MMRVDADALVRDGDPPKALVDLRIEVDAAAARSELDGIRQKVSENGRELTRIGHHARLKRDPVADSDLFFPGG